ncbi:MAG: flagellar basal body rod protein FlgF [Gammaproteobacteria bacterium]
MDRALYVAMNGAKQVQLHQATNTNNLANASTTGFRADFNAINSLPVHGPGIGSRVYSQDEHSGIDFSGGALQQTGRELDIAVSGNGFIEIQAPDGSSAYTRAGDLHTTSAGLLETGAGHPVMGNDGPIALPPFEKLEIGTDGTISILPVGQEATTLATIDRIKLVSAAPKDLFKGEDGLLRAVPDASIEADASVTVNSGVLESSNVNTVSELLDMIELTRNFEMHVKMMKEIEDNDSATTQLLRMN